VLLNVGHEGARLPVKPLKELSSNEEQLLRNQVGIGNDFHIILRNREVIVARSPIIIITLVHILQVTLFAKVQEKLTCKYKTLYPGSTCSILTSNHVRLNNPHAHGDALAASEPCHAHPRE